MCAYQFQTGSIKSRRLIVLRLRLSLNRFNSKLVRLEVQFRNVKKTRTVVFQFQTGSIRSLISGGRGVALAMKFQFQTGSIRRLVSLRALFQI